MDYKNNMLEHNIKLKVKNNKTNQSVSIDKFILRQFRWDLRTSNVIIDVDYYYDEKHLFTNEFIYEEMEEVIVDKLIKDIVRKHYES